MCARLLPLPRHVLHRPLELALELTGCCARAHDVGVAVCECLQFEPSQTFPPSPRWNADSCYVHCLAGCELSRESNPCVTFHRPDGTLRARFFGLQGGGLAIYGTATLINTNVYSNQAYGVRSLSALA